LRGSLRDGEGIRKDVKELGSDRERKERGRKSRGRDGRGGPGVKER